MTKPFKLLSCFAGAGLGIGAILFLPLTSLSETAHQGLAVLVGSIVLLLFIAVSDLIPATQMTQCPRCHQDTLVSYMLPSIDEPGIEIQYLCKNCRYTI